MSVRVNITISDDLKKYFEDWSRKTGITQSSLMALAISEYVDQKKAINAFVPMMEQLSKMDSQQDNVLK
ncbi:ribbon-helix-helix domain-containing protein [Clostridium botulinum]|uniref:ribbon-helix-helix domain-containing protein n=1 Tax=Clostridium botulinum TaxID=1491 RepID=UPI000773CC2E|nr:hypothetical protein [Clostridium botulinum]